MANPYKPQQEPPPPANPQPKAYDPQTVQGTPRQPDPQIGWYQDAGEWKYRYPQEPFQPRYNRYGVMDYSAREQQQTIPTQFAMTGSRKGGPPPYAVSFWENPANVVHYKMLLDQFPTTPGSPPPPDWLNRDVLDAAYRYFEYANGGRPASEWQFLSEQDPARQFLQGLPLPPAEFMTPNDQTQNMNAFELTLRENVDLAAMIEAVNNGTVDVDQLPPWQQTAIKTMSSPWLGAAMGAFGGGAVGLIGGPIGALIGLVGGGALGYTGAKYPDSFAGTLMQYLNIPAEAVERTLGTGIQIAGSALEPEKFGTVRDTLRNLDATWQAAGLTFDVGLMSWGNLGQMLDNVGKLYREGLEQAGVTGTAADIAKSGHPLTLPLNIPAFVYMYQHRDEIGEGYAGPGEVWHLGVPIPIELRGPAGLAIITDARRRLISGRETADEIMADYTFRLGFSGQLANMLGQAVADPLNHVGWLASRGIRSIARMQGNEALAAALTRPLGGPKPNVLERVLNLTDPASELIPGLQTYREFLRTNPLGNAPTVDNMTAFQRFFAGLTKEGTIRELDPAYMAPDTSGALGRMWATLTNLTPEAKAKTLAGSSANVFQVIATMSDPEDFIGQVNFLKRFIQESPGQWTETAAFLGAPEAQTVRQAIHGFEDVADQHATTWQLTDQMRGVARSAAETVGMQPGEFVRALQDPDQAGALFRQLTEAMQAAGETGPASTLRTMLAEGTITAENIADTFRVFTGENAAPLYPQEGLARLAADFIEHVEQWATQAYKLGPDSSFYRLVALQKASTGLFILGFNPNYLVGNVAWDMVMRPASGVFGFEDTKVISQFFDDIGVEPFFARAGVGAADIGPQFVQGTARTAVEETVNAMRNMADEVVMAAKKPAPGPLTSAEQAVSKANQIAPFNRATQAYERYESLQATYFGMRQFINRFWRPKVGFDPLPAGLRQGLAGIDPRLPDVIEAMVQGSRNTQQIQANLFELVARRNLDSYINDIAPGLGREPAEVAEILQQMGVHDFLNERLSTANTTTEKASVFSEVQQRINSALDERVYGDLPTRWEEVANRTGSSGMTEAVRLFDEMQFYRWEAWNRHFEQWQYVFEQSGKIDRDLEGMLIQSQKLASRQDWVRTNRFEDATYRGMFQALGAESEPTANFMRLLGEQQDTWRTFFKGVDDAHTEFFSREWPTVLERTEAWEGLQIKLAEDYANAAVAEAGLQAKMDLILTDVFQSQYGDEVAEIARKWRSEQANFTSDRTRLMTQHRKAVAQLKRPERNQAWTAFLRDQYMPFIRDFYTRDAQWMYDVHSAASGKMDRVRFLTGDAEALIRSVDDGGVPTTVTSNMRRILQENGISAEDIRTRSPQELVDLLRERQTPASPEYTPPPVPDETDPVLAARAETVRKFAAAAEYPIPSRDAAGNRLWASDDLIREAILEYGNDQVRLLYNESTPLSDMRPGLVDDAFRRRDYVMAREGAARADAQIEVPDTPEELVARARAQQVAEARRTLVETPREQLPPPISEAVRLEAQALLDDLNNGGYIGLVRVPSDAPNAQLGMGRVRMSENAQWYRDLYTEGFTSRTTVENALQRIIDGADGGDMKYVTRMKELIIDRLASGNPDTGLPPHPGVLAEMGMLDEAGRALGPYMEDGFMRPEDLVPEANMNRVVDRWLELAGTENVATHPDLPDGGRQAMPDGMNPLRATELRAIRQQLFDRAVEAQTAAGIELAKDASISQFTVMDSMAAEWARRTGRDPLEWYATYLADMAYWDTLPESVRNTLSQSAPPLDTPQFRDWFQSSKVVDADGKPLVVYHGSPSNFDAFSYDKLGAQGTTEGYGFYFTNKRDVAGGYATRRAPDGGSLYEVYLSIQKPLNPDGVTITRAEFETFMRALDPDGNDFLSNYGDVSWEGYESVLQKAVNSEFSGRENDVNLISSIINGNGGDPAAVYTVLRDTLGYDGIIDKGWGVDHELYLAFFPEQVKATGNVGTWDPNDPRMMFQGYGGSALPRGAVAFGDDGRAIINFYKNANITTGFHEIGHVFRRTLADAEMDIMAKAGGLADAAELRRLENLYQAGTISAEDSVRYLQAEENFARGFERYLAEGGGPTGGIASRGYVTRTIEMLYDRLKQWLLEVYKRISGSEIDVDIQTRIRTTAGEASLRDIFDRYLADEQVQTMARSRLDALEQRYQILANVDQRAETWATSVETPPPYTELPADPTPGTIDPEVMGRISEARRELDAAIEAGDRAAIDRILRDRIADLEAEMMEPPRDVLPDGTELLNPGEPVAEGPLSPGSLEYVGNPRYFGMQEAQGYGEIVRPILDALEERVLQAEPELTFRGGDLSPELQAELRAWMNKLNGQMASVKLGAANWGENRRNAVLLPYHRRFGGDNILNIRYPYSFFYTRTIWQFFTHLPDRIGWLANTMRLRDFQQQAISVRNFPTRLQGKFAIPAPYLPEWAGGNVYVDPMRYANPMELVTSPIGYYLQDTKDVEFRAEEILRRRVLDGEVDQAQAEREIEARNGSLWNTAMRSAQEELDKNVGSPMDMVNALLAESFAFNVIGNINRGTPEKISVLPATRFGQALRTIFGEASFPFNILGMAGNILAKPEEWVRERAGLSEFGEWGDWYIDRAVSNMATEGTYTIDEILTAMIDRKGPIFQEARERVQLEMALRVPGATTAYAVLNGAEPGDIAASLLYGWMPAGLFPEGELEQRGLKSEYDAARMRYNEGDRNALNQFFDDNPEYRARLALFDEPEGRLRQFLVNQIWDAYYQQTSDNRRLITQQLGPQFETAFLNSETRSYDAIDMQQMAVWAKRLQAYVPDVSLIPPLNVDSLLSGGGLLPDTASLNLIPEAQAKAIEAYRSDRDGEFPNWYALQQRYYSLASRGEKAAFLQQFPELSEYWEHNREFKADHPELLPYLESFQYQQWHVERGQPYVSIEVDGAPAYVRAFWQWKGENKATGGGGGNQRPTAPTGFTNNIVTRLRNYFDDGALDEFTRNRLYTIWASGGWPSGDFDTWLNVVLREKYGPNADQPRPAESEYPTMPNGMTFNPGDFQGTLASKLSRYYSGAEALGSGSSARLRQIWEGYGYPGDSFDEWVESLRAYFA